MQTALMMRSRQDRQTHKGGNMDQQEQQHESREMRGASK